MSESKHSRPHACTQSVYGSCSQGISHTVHGTSTDLLNDSNVEVALDHSDEGLLAGGIQHPLLNGGLEARTGVNEHWEMEEDTSHS